VKIRIISKALLIFTVSLPTIVRKNRLKSLLKHNVINIEDESVFDDPNKNNPA